MGTSLISRINFPSVEVENCVAFGFIEWVGLRLDRSWDDAAGLSATNITRLTNEWETE
jgi:hypothetical protein